jgi:hypothetical protein
VRQLDRKLDGMILVFAEKNDMLRARRNAPKAFKTVCP